MSDSTIESRVASGPEVASTSSDALFVRNATGLVRGFSQRDNLVLAALAGAPAVYVALAVFFVLGGLPGGSIFLGGLLTIPIMIAVSGCFGLMTAAFPRSGGDYTIVTRVLTPGLGLISSFCMWMGGLALSGAGLGVIAAQFGVAPSLQTIGVVAHSDTLIRWGTSVATGKGWWFAIGTLAFLIGAAAHWAGPRWIRRVLYLGFFGSTAGLVFATLVALFTSRHGFQVSFNETVQALTGSPDTYGDVLAGATKAGVDVTPSFSWASTIPVIGVFATSTIYTYFAAFAGGELRQANSSRTWTRMAFGGALTILVDIVCIAILFSAWGKPFVTAAFAGGYPAELGSVPSYFTLTSYQLGSTAIAVLLCVSFLLVFPMAAVQLFLGMTRILFAYSFDGILPRRVATVSRRTNAPTVAIGITLVLYLAALAWGIFGADNLLQIIVYLTMIQLVSMILVAISAIVFPYRRRALFQASGATSTAGGVPLVTLFGIGALIGCTFVMWVYFHYPYFGLADKGKFFGWFGGTLAAAVVFYASVRLLKRRQGTDLSLVYAEIPPE